MNPEVARLLRKAAQPGGRAALGKDAPNRQQPLAKSLINGTFDGTPGSRPLFPLERGVSKLQRVSTMCLILIFSSSQDEYPLIGRRKECT